MALLADLKILWHMAFSPVRGKTHAQRLDSFYQKQARDYDRFRQRLLKGRQELYSTLEAPAGGVWVDVGGGTGANLEFAADRIAQMSRVVIVDLCPSLLKIANDRIRDRGWTNLQTREADAASFDLEGQQADVITFSYSLTMMPEWFAAIENACRLLKPGGRIGVVDFYVSHKFPPPGQTRHSWFTRMFWPMFFATDNVHLGPDRLACLQWRFKQQRLEERRAAVPYMLGLKAPHFIFVGQKR